MKKLITTAFLLSALGAATAGYKQTKTVVVQGANHNAWGVLASARNSANNVEYIGCNVYSASSKSANCFAKDAAGVYMTCWTSDTGIINTAQNISADTYLYFSWDASNMCTSVYVENASQYEPKQ